MDKDKDKGKGVVNTRIRGAEKALHDILMALRSLAVYRELSQLPTWQLLKHLLEGTLEEHWPSSKLFEGYYEFLNTFLSSSIRLNSDGHLSDEHLWKEWILDALLYTENKFTLGVENSKQGSSKAMTIAVNHDLDCIRKVADIPWNDLISILEDRIGNGGGLLNIFSDDEERSWVDLCISRGLEGWDIDSLVKHYRSKGSGIFSIYNGFYWDGASLKGIENTDPITLEQLLGYDIQKQILLENTDKFVSGYPANNVLLYGDKGTGKSSLVKALIHKYSDDGLRIIELPKIHLGDYHKILSLIEDRRFRFILFIDDLSFEEHEIEYKHVKALLEGGLKVRPSNVLVYATSNRRHLVREIVSDRSSTGYNYNDRNEISPTDSMQEKLSLSDRFGITLTFISPNQRGYLDMIEAMARERGIDIDREMLHERALMWEKRYNGRSGRTAKQFIDDLVGATLHH